MATIIYSRIVFAVLPQVYHKHFYCIQWEQ